MTTGNHREISAVEFSDDQYTVEQTGQDKNFRPEYEARDAAGDALFRGTYNMYQSKDEFAFVDADGDEIFTVTASGTWDVAGEYLLADSHTGKDIAVLDNDFSMFQDTWRVLDPEHGELLAEINSRGALATIGRTLLPFGKWIGHEFEVTDSEGDPAGSITGEFGMFDQYEIVLEESGSVPTPPIVIGAIVIDAIQDN